MYGVSAIKWAGEHFEDEPKFGPNTRQITYHISKGDVNQHEIIICVFYHHFFCKEKKIYFFCKSES